MGPVQIVVVGFEDGRFDGGVLQELRRLREHDIVRLLDLLVVARDDRGEVSTLELSDLSGEEAEQLGALTRALIGEGGLEPAPEVRAAELEGGDAWDVLDVIPHGTAAAIALLEHRWAIPLGEGIARAGGTPLADAWVHRDDLAAVGLR